MYKKKLIILSITLVVLILTVGIAYAYFSASYIENTNEEMIVSGDIVLRIDDVNIVTNENMIPGDYIEKKFSVTNTSSSTTSYDIWFSDVINNFDRTSEIVYKLYSNDGGNNIISDNNSVPTAAKLITSCSIAGNTTHTYTLKIIYKDIDFGTGNSINNMGKTASFKIKINEETNIARIQDGSNFNKKIKQLANPNETVNYSSFADTNIKGFQRANTLDTSKDYIDLAYYKYEPIYAWFEDGIIYYYSDLDTIYIYDCSHMFEGFKGITEFTWPSDWSTTYTNNMSYMFKNASGFESIDLSNMDTQNVKTMADMFSDAQQLIYLDISNFNTSNVVNMSYMFSCTKQLTSIDLSSFDTSNVIDMSHMFYIDNQLTSLNLSNFNTSNVTNMSYMFSYVTLTSLDLSSFNTSNVTNMSNMFSYAKQLTSLNISSFNTSGVTDMSDMFNSLPLTSLDLSNFDTSNVTNMNGMFSNMTNLTSVDLSSFNTEKVTNMGGMFNNMTSMTNINVSNFNTSKVTYMSQMFNSMTNLQYLDVSNFDTSKVTNMQGMFSKCSSLTKLDLSSFNSASLTTISSNGCGGTNCSMSMFVSDTNLETIIFGSDFKLSSVTNMQGMFKNCENLKDINVSYFDTSNVTNMREVFYNCKELTVIDLSEWDTSKVNYMYGMFGKNIKLTTIYVGNGWDTSLIESTSDIFDGDINIVGGAGTTYITSLATYAHVDGGPDNPGYLTLKTT